MKTRKPYARSYSLCALILTANLIALALNPALAVPLGHLLFLELVILVSLPVFPLKANPIYWYFFFWYFLAFSLQPLFSGYYIVGPGTHSGTLWSITLSLGCVTLGHCVPVVPRPRPRQTQLRSNWDTNRVRLACSILAVIAVVAWALFINLLDTNITEFVSRSQLVRLRLNDYPFSVALRNFAYWASWSLFWVPFIHSRGRLRGSGHVVALTLLFILLLTWTFFLAQRSLLLLPALYLLYLLYAYRRVRLTASLVVAVFGCFLFVSYAMHIYRSLSFGAAPSLVALTDGFLGAGDENPLVSAVSTSFDSVRFLEMTLERVPAGELGGASYLGVFTAFVPARYYPGKPEFTDNYLHGVFFRDYSGTFSFSYIAELWVNFGWGGIVLGSLLIGIGLRVCDWLVARWVISSGGQLWFASCGLQMPYVIASPYSLALYDVALYTVCAVLLHVSLLRRGPVAALHDKLAYPSGSTFAPQEVTFAPRG